MHLNIGKCIQNHYIFCGIWNPFPIIVGPNLVKTHNLIPILGSWDDPNSWCVLLLNRYRYMDPWLIGPTYVFEWYYFQYNCTRIIRDLFGVLENVTWILHYKLWRCVSVLISHAYMVPRVKVFDKQTSEPGNIRTRCDIPLNNFNIKIDASFTMSNAVAFDPPKLSLRPPVIKPWLYKETVSRETYSNMSDHATVRHAWDLCAKSQSALIGVNNIRIL